MQFRVKFVWKSRRKRISLELLMRKLNPRAEHDFVKEALIINSTKHILYFEGGLAIGRFLLLKSY